MTNRRARSIQFRLTAWYTAILAATFILIGAGVWLALNRSIEDTADRELRSRLEDVRRYYNGFSKDDLAHLEEEFREESLLGQSTSNIRISDARGKWLFKTPGTENWPVDFIATELPQEGRFATVSLQRRRMRLVTAPVRVGVVQIGLPIDEFEEVRDGFLWLTALGSPVLLLFAWLGGYWMSGRALKPVDAISAKAANIGAGRLNVRLQGSGTGDELDRLADVLNGMLERIENAFKRVTDFTADASHELRTPVAVVQTTAELMRSQPRSVAEHVAGWERVGAETGRMANLISDLLTLARADADRSKSSFERVDLNAIVQSAAEEMRVLAEDKGIQFKVAAAEPIEISGDADGIRRVVCILLDNAIKYTESGGAVSVEIKSGAQIELDVTDTGCGIDSSGLPHVFERFYRVSKDRSRKSGGTGLGLAIAKQIVEQHGGEIRVRSRPQIGSVFTVVLPKPPAQTVSPIFNSKD